MSSADSDSTGSQSFSFSVLNETDSKRHSHALCALDREMMSVRDELPPPLHEEHELPAPIDAYAGQTLARRMEANDTTVDKRKCDGCDAHR